MIGSRHGPPQRAEFERLWGSPYGFRSPSRQELYRIGRALGSLRLQAHAVGPFGFQPDNNATRSFEYPWAYYAVPVRRGDMAVDLGGSLGGLQFVLSKAGLKVINVDPGETASMGWKVDPANITALNRAFGTSVELRRAFLQDAGIPSASVDRLYAISTIEHIPGAELPLVAKEIGRVLKPGGFAVLTIDLFYDLAPFTARQANVHGTNIDVKAFVDASGLELHLGRPEELCGYPAFDPPAILARAMEFVQGDRAVNTTQALVLRKP